MINTKMIIKQILFSLLIAMTISCSKEATFEQQFIEDNFLKIVDTLPYSTGTFVSLPKDTIAYSDLAVNLTPEINYNKKMEEFVLSFFEENPDLKKVYLDVLEKGKYSKFPLDTTFPKQIGKYHLFPEVPKENKLKYAGRIDIENLKIYNDKAILVLSESVDHFGVTYILLLKKEGNKWKVFRRETLMQS
jgi:hypothetical protein